MIAGVGIMAGPALAGAQVVLTFEGLKDSEGVLNYYNGGVGSLGSTGGTNYGASFSSNALALIRNNAGGAGNFGGEPSPSTILFFTSGSATTLNYAAGFSTGFSFFYSAVNNPGSIRVFDGLNDTGNLLATLTLPTTLSAGAACPNNPGARFCPFVPIGVAFSGTARSIDFGGTTNQIAFDNITFGSATPMSAVPEPGTVALIGAGLAGLGVVARRRRT
ncbi:MAG: PEP-CTERM sorting domain-containing protein [Candidatus Eremiobacteraeota bacterium]|nr:PEP-CTERM sorting domain-containing protein [Candidatus Eremiobacteraeota bacterium]